MGALLLSCYHVSTAWCWNSDLQQHATTNVTLESAMRYVLIVRVNIDRCARLRQSVKPDAKHTTELRKKNKTKKKTSFGQPTSLTARWQSLSNPA